MLINKILLPVDLPNASLRVAHQAALLARHFHSQILLLHVVPPLSYPAGVLDHGHECTRRSWHAGIVQQAQHDPEQSLRAELDGIAVKSLLLNGDPARAIAETARSEGVSLIVMSGHGDGVFHRWLRGSAIAQVLQDSECPVWTDTCREEAPAREWSIRNVLCAVDLTHHSRTTLSGAAQMAAAFGARLTLVHITGGVEVYGPGGPHVLPWWKQTLVGLAARDIAKLQQEVGTEADVIIDSGNVRKLLNRAAEQARGDLLVIRHMTSRGHWGANGRGYPIIRESHIPVLSV